MTEAFRIEDAASTHVGNVRKENEDSLLAAPHSGLWLVADGMGGHANGQFASRTIVATPITMQPASFTRCNKVLSGRPN